MVSRDVAALFMEHTPDDEIRSLRDSIAKAEAELSAPRWERHRELHGRIEELKEKCEAAAHSLTIVLAGNVGTRRRLLINSRNERRTCIICGTEVIAFRIAGKHRYSQTKISRSMFRSRTRDGALRLRTITC